MKGKFFIFITNNKIYIWKYSKQLYKYYLFVVWLSFFICEIFLSCSNVWHILIDCYLLVVVPSHTYMSLQMMFFGFEMAENFQLVRNKLSNEIFWHVRISWWNEKNVWLLNESLNLKLYEYGTKLREEFVFVVQFH